LEKSKAKSFTCREILPTKLCTHKDDVEFINTKELSSLEATNKAAKQQTYKSMDEGDSLHSKKILNLLCPAKDELVLSVNCQVMLIKNLDVAGGLVNGARGYVRGFSENKMPIVKFLNGSELTLKYESWSFKMNSSGQVLQRRQIPLQLAWAISIHKSQVIYI
jgi:ATP-dependent DNA helicase PIF1